MLDQEPLGEARGRVILISSQHGMIGPPGHFAYAVSKGGIVNMTHQLAVDYGPRGILVNAIAPGKIITGAPGNLDPDAIAYSHARTPFARLGRPDGRRRRRAVPGRRGLRLCVGRQPAGRRRLDGVLRQARARRARPAPRWSRRRRARPRSRSVRNSATCSATCSMPGGDGRRIEPGRGQLDHAVAALAQLVEQRVEERVGDERDAARAGIGAQRSSASRRARSSAGS